VTQTEMLHEESDVHTGTGWWPWRFSFVIYGDKRKIKVNLRAAGGTVIRGSLMPFFKLAFSTDTAVCVHVVALHWIGCCSCQ